MWWWPKLFARKTQLQELEKDRQTLHLTVTEQQRQIRQLKQEIGRLRSSAHQELQEIVDAKMENLLQAIATPVTQLFTQAHLLKQNKPVAATDIMSVAMRLLHTLQDIELEVIGNVGDTMQYDMNVHDVLVGEPPVEGTPVVIKFVGIKRRQKIVRKVGVALSK